LYRDEFENLYISAVANCIRLVKKHKKLDEPQSDQVSNEIKNNTAQNVSSVRSSVRNQASVIKLVALEIPKFSGDYKQWSSFKDIFTARVTDIQTFFYLKAALFSDAKRVIQPYETSANNYLVTWNCLNERFNNKKNNHPNAH